VILAVKNSPKVGFLSSSICFFFFYEKSWTILSTILPSSVSLLLAGVAGAGAGVEVSLFWTISTP